MIDVNPDLLAFLKEEEVRSRNEDLLDRAEANLRSYRGEYYGDEVDGRSKAVSRDVAEVIDHMEVSVLRTFVSGDRVVEFEPINQGDEQAADDATEVMHRDFQRKGYKLLHDWFKEGNIAVLGVVKSCYERKKKKVERVLPEAMLGIIEGEIVSKKKEGDDPEFGKLVRVTTIEEGPPQFVDRLVPLEEFRMSPDGCTLEEKPYLAHAVPKLVSDLVEMGFDRDLVETAHDETSPELLTSLAQARSPLDYYDYGPNRGGALRQVLLMEEYVRFDLDEDGIAERLCVHRVGDTVLKVEEVDYQPFVIYCPFPMPGRVDGEALAEKVTDIQRINTALLRLGLDGLYCNLAPGYLVPDSAVNENTYDDLLTVRPNRIVRYSGVVPPMMETKQDVSGTAFQAIEFMIGQRESRTGITRLNQGLDADALNKTATGTALMQAQGQQMEEYLARNFAESVACLMALKLKLYRRYGEPIQMRVDGEYRQADPTQWPEEMELAIRVGLGTGRKEHRLQNRMMLLEIQREVMMAGLPIVGPEQIYKSINGVVRDASLGSPADFVIDPSTIPPQPPQPNPDEQKMQAEMQLQAAKLEMQAQEGAAKMAMAQQDARAKADLDQQKAEAELRLALMRHQFDMEMLREKQRLESQLGDLKAQGIALEQEGAVEKANLEREVAADKAMRERQAAAQKANLDRQKTEADIIGDQREASADIQLAREKAAAEAELAIAKAEFEAQQAKERFEFEKQMALEKQALDETLAVHDHTLKEESAQRDGDREDYKAISKNRSGGKLDE